MKILVLSMLCACSLLSCAKFSLTDANAIQKGMSYSEVISKVSKKPMKEFDITIYSAPSKKYFVQVYELHNGGDNSDYLAVFENDKLLYWGYPYEFNRHPDATLNEIGKTAVAEYEKLK